MFTHPIDRRDGLPEDFRAACQRASLDHLLASFATSSASLRLRSDWPIAAGPPAAAAPLPNFTRMTASRIGLTAAYDIWRIEVSIYAETASESTILIV